ncbi:MAG: tetratricopeptide repeat protein [Candidatus Wallbacteria bacterium]|nr:tetratricopeptide repeat protein [Candidatus Wallbacteria bacterium]
MKKAVRISSRKKKQQHDKDKHIKPAVLFDFPNSYALIKKVIDLCPNESKLFVQIGNIIWGLSLPEKTALAAQFFEKAVKLDPENPDLLWNLGKCLEQSEQFEKAIPVLEKYESINDRDFVNVEHSLLNAYVAMDMREKARMLYNKQLKKDRKRAKSYWGHIEKLFADRDADRQLIDSFVSIEPKLKCATSEPALDKLQHIIRVGLWKSHDQYQMLLFIGKLLQKYGFYQASSLYLKKWSLYARSICCYQTRYLLAKAYNVMKKTGEARNILEKLTLLIPDFKEAQFELGITYHLLGLTEEVQNQYEKLCELDPKLAKAFKKRIS